MLKFKCDIMSAKIYLGKVRLSTFTFRKLSPEGNQMDFTPPTQPYNKVISCFLLFDLTLSNKVSPNQYVQYSSFVNIVSPTTSCFKWTDPTLGSSNSPDLCLWVIRAICVLKRKRILFSLV